MQKKERKKGFLSKIIKKYIPKKSITGFLFKTKGREEIVSIRVFRVQMWGPKQKKNKAKKNKKQL